jgi:hypothetical protein
MTDIKDQIQGRNYNQQIYDQVYGTDYRLVYSRLLSQIYQIQDRVVLQTYMQLREDLI